MNTLLVILVALIMLGGIVALLDHLPFGAETHTLSTREFPNIAAELHSAHRDTVAHP